MRFVIAALSFALLMTQAGSAAPADLGRANFAWSPGPDVPQVAVALEGQLWKQRGLTVQPVNVATGRDALEALIGGQVDFASMAEFPVVIGAMQQKNFRVIAILSRYRGNRVITTTTSGIGSLKDLANKKVGVTLGTNANYQSDTVMQAAGVTVTNVNSAPSDLVPALARGDIDAAVLFPSFFPQAKKILGERYREFRTPAYATTFVIAATTDVIEKHPERVKAFLSGLIAANAAVAGNRTGAAASASKLMGGVASTDAILGLWSDYHFEVSLDPELLTLLVKEGAWIHKQGLVKGPEPSEQLLRSYIDTTPLRDLTPHNVSLR